MLLDMSGSPVKVGFMQLHQPNLFTLNSSPETMSQKGGVAEFMITY
jgi:hypothetical protein